MRRVIPSEVGGSGREGLRAAAHPDPSTHARDDKFILKETLAALDLEPDVMRHWLERSRRFCERHGGEKRYAEWMALYDEALEAIDAR